MWHSEGSFFTLKGLLLLSVCLPTYIGWVSHVLKGQKRSLDSLELEVERVVSCHVGVGNWTRVLYKSSQWRESHLSSPMEFLPLFSTKYTFLAFSCTKLPGVYFVSSTLTFCGWTWQYPYSRMLFERYRCYSSVNQNLNEDHLNLSQYFGSINSTACLSCSLCFTCTQVLLKGKF